jgi:4-amino-4-deoxy-L-arabinose transferase-like glycosyltransferase
VEKSTSPENRENESKADLTVPLMILTFLACAWLVYAYINRAWLDAFQQVTVWILNPSITYTPVPIVGVPWAFLATVEVLVLGFTCSYMLLNNEKDANIKFLSIVGLGFGLTGFITIVLGIFGNLFQLPLNIIILFLSATFLSVIIYRKKKIEKVPTQENLTPHLSLPKIKLPPNIKFWLPACIAIAIIFFFVFYHALLTIIVHWDAVVYHAAMAVIMYRDHAIPVIAGPSIGLEMSANFPPLFSALGAYYYIQIGSVQDIFLRAIPPVMGLFTILATYKIGEIIAGKKLGVLSALFLAVTPLFFRYSIYATSYSTITFFCTVSILFLLLGMTKGDTKYWVSCGVFFGFAVLTSYISLYLAPFLIIALIAYLAQKRNTIRVTVKKISLLILAVFVIGGVWYLRNYLVVGNPIYPNAYTVLGGINIDPRIEQITFNSIVVNAANNFFGGTSTSFFDRTMIFLTYRTQFPSVSLFTILGLVLLPTIRNKKFWLIALWPLSLSIFILSGLSWGFPHHVIVAMPGFALISALPIIKVLDICKKYDSENSKNALLNIRNRLPSIRKSNLLRITLVIILLVAFLFPSLTLVMGGKVVEDNLFDPVPADYLWFLEHPNSDTWTVLDRLYPQAVTWQFMNTNLKPGEKAATIENNIYYVKDCNSDYFFYLDGWEARALYNITDPVLMVQFLREQNVKYVIDEGWTRQTGHYDILPLAKYLGSPSPYFPTIFNNASNPAIYRVGPLESPITNTSQITVSTNQAGWSQVETVNGLQTQSVIAGNDSARLYVATPDLTIVSITYLDVGNDTVAVNVRDPTSPYWINGYEIIQKTGSDTWKTFDFLAPMTDKGAVELALHAYDENFTVSKIDAKPIQSEGRASLSSINSTLTMKITNNTMPPTLTVYLPMLNASETLTVNATSNGQPIGIELYEGVIQPWETTNWWHNHNLATRSPAFTNSGLVDPSMVWETKHSGLYTVVIVLRDSYRGDATVALQINVSTSGGGLTK